MKLESLKEKDSHEKIIPVTESALAGMITEEEIKIIEGKNQS